MKWRHLKDQLRSDPQVYISSFLFSEPWQGPKSPASFDTRNWDITFSYTRLNQAVLKNSESDILFKEIENAGFYYPY